jgi:hypothetical protein
MDEYIEVSKEVSSNGNPKMVKKICEWTGEEFWVNWKCRNRRFKDITAMYEWRKDNTRETIKCETCGTPFKRSKNAKGHWRTGNKPRHCSKKCFDKSPSINESRRKWTIENQPMNNSESRKKISKTKKKKYGDPNYNNLEKNKETMIEKYGVPYAVYLPQCQSVGKSISKFQRREYEKIKAEYPDALLEEYLPDVDRSVDIYIPSEKKIIECFGDYWHMNPEKYLAEDYNKNIHKTAKEIWEFDNERIELFKNKGYLVEIIWEN